MSFDNKPLINAFGNKPAPQYYNPNTDKYEVIQGENGANFVSVTGEFIEEYFENMLNYTKIFLKPMIGFAISHDGANGTADLMFQIGTQNIRVKPGEVFEGRFKPFTMVVITAGVPYRAYGLSGTAGQLLQQDTTAPTEVRQLGASAITYASLTLSWLPSLSTDIFAYEIYQGGSLLGTVTMGSLSYDVKSLHSSTPYNFTVKSRDSSGNVSVGATIGPITTPAAPQGADTTPPEEVTLLSTSNISHNAMTVSWIASASPDVANYDIYQNGILIATMTGTAVNVTSLQPATSYTFLVRSRDIWGNVSAGATRTQATAVAPADITAPPVPTNVIAVAGNLQVRITWNAVGGPTSADLKGYHIYRNSLKITAQPTTDTSYIDNQGLTNGANYTYNVTSIDFSLNESALSATVNATPQLPAPTPGDVTAPEKVTGVNVTNVLSNGLQVNWSAIANAAADLAYYEVSYSLNGTAWTIASNTIVGSALSYSLTNLTNNTLYYIRVRAIDTANNISVPSDTISQTTAVGNPVVFSNFIPTGSATTNASTLNWKMTKFTLKNVMSLAEIRAFGNPSSWELWTVNTNNQMIDKIASGQFGAASGTTGYSSSPLPPNVVLDAKSYGLTCNYTSASTNARYIMSATGTDDTTIQVVNRYSNATPKQGSSLITDFIYDYQLGLSNAGGALPTAIPLQDVNWFINASAPILNSTSAGWKYSAFTVKQGVTLYDILCKSSASQYEVWSMNGTGVNATFNALLVAATNFTANADTSGYATGYKHGYLSPAITFTAGNTYAIGVNYTAADAVITDVTGQGSLLDDAFITVVAAGAAGHASVGGALSLFYAFDFGVDFKP